MPLSFQSENHGTIAFGFFNIESDMLLLENCFFFADDFCKWMIDLSSEEKIESKTVEGDVFQISDPHQIGDLMGAIHGIHFSGFIGEIYKQFPFPSAPEDFKQNPEGVNTREIVKTEIKPFAEKISLTIDFSEPDTVIIGPCQFTRTVFHQLLNYVWEGGYPRWKESRPPAYVLEMKKQLQNSYNVFFKNAF